MAETGKRQNQPCEVPGYDTDRIAEWLRIKELFKETDSLQDFLGRPQWPVDKR